MSLLGAMNTAISGLNAQERAMSNISDNVANSQTVGYKAIDTNFESLVTYSGQSQLPGSVAALASYKNDVGGNLIQAQQATSIAVNGNGFFQVKGPAANTGAAETFNATDYYTRRGDFTQDKFGYLVNGAGYTLEGFPVNSTTGLVSGSTAVPIQVPQGQSAPSQTTLTNLVANLPSSSPINTAANYVKPSPVTTQVYDVQGNPHTLSIQFDKTAANTWTAAITAVGSTAPATNLQLTFSDGTNVIAGSATAAPAGTLIGITDTSTPANSTIATVGSGNPATVGLSFAFGGAAQTISLGLGDWGNASGLTQYAGSGVSVTSQTQDGYASGSLTSMGIDSDGFVAATYTNGQTIKVAQIAVAQFAAPDQLNEVNGGAFAESVDSGTANISIPNSQGAGSISPSTLEQSNVSLSTELTSLISAQQAYTSNSKVISTANQMIQVLDQLIQ